MLAINTRVETKPKQKLPIEVDWTFLFVNKFFSNCCSILTILNWLDLAWFIGFSSIQAAFLGSTRTQTVRVVAYFLATSSHSIGGIQFLNKRVQLKCSHQSALFTLQSHAVISPRTSSLPLHSPLPWLTCLPRSVAAFPYPINDSRQLLQLSTRRLGWNFQAHEDLSSCCSGTGRGKGRGAGRGGNRCAMRPM